MDVMIVFFRKVTTKRQGKEYIYLKLIENYREGGKVKQRVIANLGNVERLAPEKVQALIGGLAKICGTTSLEQLINVEYPPSPTALSIKPFRTAWHNLAVDRVLAKVTWTGRVPAYFPQLIEAMVIQSIVNPTEHRPINVACAEFEIEDLDAEDLHGIDYYRAICELSSVIPEIESTLWESIQPRVSSTTHLAFSIVAGEFIGHECGITSAGTAYQVRPYRKPLRLAIISHPDGIPLACRIISDNPSVVRAQIEASFRIPTVAVFDQASDADPETTAYVLAVPPEHLADVPLGGTDPWNGTGSIEAGIWSKAVRHSTGHYVICHDLTPDAPSDQALENQLIQASRELDELKAAVRQKKLVREKTILRKAAGILAEHQCQDLIHCRFNPNKNSLHYYRCEEVIKQLKSLRRTLALKTDLADLPPSSLIKLQGTASALADRLRVVHDLTKMPVIYPYSDHQHSEAFIAGQVCISALGLAVKRVVELSKPT